MTYRLWTLIFIVFLSLEMWFRLRNRVHHNLMSARGSGAMSESFYLFESAEQMRIHPAYSNYGLGDMSFFDELQASHQKVHVSPVESRNVTGLNINIVNGERITKNPNFEEKMGRSECNEHWILLGGSTVLCLEVPDSMTSSSHLQAIVDNSSNKTIQVHNFGQAGFKAVKIDQLFPLFLSRYTMVSRIIVYFGVNDAGWIAGSRSSNRLTYLCDAVLDVFSFFSKFVAFIALRMKSRRVCKASSEYAQKTLRKFFEYRDYFEARNVPIHFVLQPNVFCKARPSKFEISLIDSAEPLRIAGLHSAYKTYLDHGEGLITSAVGIFSEMEESIFLDWCHVGTKGNALIARKIWEVINDDVDSDIKTIAAMNIMKKYRDIVLRSRNIFKNKDEVAYNYPLY
jgi:hypothetical protein